MEEETAENLYRNGQIHHAIARPIDGLKFYDNNQQEIEELKQSKIQNETKHDQLTHNYNTERDINEIKQKHRNNTDVEEKLYIVANNSFQMRLKVLSMELKVAETFISRGLIENGNDIGKNRDNIKNCFKRIDEELFAAERSSTHLMRKIEEVVKRNTVKKEVVKKTEEDKKVLDYRSIVTVRGTKEDVSICILKAKTALDNGKYDRAESLLLKAERIFPTKNARDLLKQVRAAKEPKQNSDPTENSSQYKADFKDTKPPLKEKPVKTSINIPKKAIDDQEFENSTSLTAEPITFDENAKTPQKKMRVNCYKFPDKANDTDKAESLKCIRIAQPAFNEGLHDKAEHFLKSLKIFKNQDAKFFLENVRNAKAQNITNVKTEKSYNEHINNHSKADRFTSIAFGINANDDAQKQPEHIQDVNPLKPLSDEPITSKPVKSHFDFKEGAEAKLCHDLAVEALICNKFHVARFYLEWALKERPNEETRELLRNAQAQIDNHKRGQESDVLFEANKLLDRADNLIRIGDLEQAEFFLIVSWTLRKNRRTISIHNKFLEARLALFYNNAVNKRDGKNNGYSQNIFESDTLVKLALDKYKKHQLEEAEKLLMRAAEFYPSVRIDKLLVEIRGCNNGERLKI